MLPIVGLRIIKTVISVGISISIARLLKLEPAHFAGVVSMLAVQPSVFRSLWHSLSHIASALFAAMLGIAIALTLGNAALTIAFVTLAVMALHVKLRRTASLQLAVIVGINTMGTFDELSGSAAENQILLVLIGMVVGTAVNAVRKPVHNEREEVLLAKSEGMLSALLHYVQIELQVGRISPYKPNMRQQIEEVRSYIAKGKEISLLIHEDRFMRKNTEPAMGNLFDIYETMIERIRDMIKALQKADLDHPETKRLIRAISLVIRVQDRTQLGKPVPIRLLIQALHPDESIGAVEASAIRRLFPFHQAYEALAEYSRELTAVQTLIPVFRPQPPI